MLFYRSSAARVCDVLERSLCSSITQQCCYDGLMPSIDPEAKAFELDMAAEFGRAVNRRRKALKLTAIEVARRTAELGFPISRGAIAKIETNSRSGKMDVIELLVLAAALEIPPVLLLFPEFPEGRQMAVIPYVVTRGHEAVRWMSGRISFPREVSEFSSPPLPPNDGVKLVTAAEAVENAIESRIPLVNQLEKAKDSRDAELARRTLQIHDERIARLQNEVDNAYSDLWGDEDYSEYASDD